MKMQISAGGICHSSNIDVCPKTKKGAAIVLTSEDETKEFFSYFLFLWMRLCIQCCWINEFIFKDVHFWLDWLEVILVF